MKEKYIFFARQKSLKLISSNLFKLLEEAQFEKKEKNHKLKKLFSKATEGSSYLICCYSSFVSNFSYIVK